MSASVGRSRLTMRLASWERNPDFVFARRSAGNCAHLISKPKWPGADEERDVRLRALWDEARSLQCPSQDDGLEIVARSSDKRGRRGASVKLDPTPWRFQN